ncbi:hypothetical protein NQD34_009267 [Periophthalmus magnuspinnatus]|nr:hypothetical protein NQD34_009267 [Periophthalmus magnuspinnatus]
MQIHALLLWLTCFMLLQCPHVQSHHQFKDAPVSSLQKEVRSRPGSRPETRLDSVKKGEGLMEKLLRLDDMHSKENDVMEPKRKRGFSGNSAPLDRLSVGGSSMESKQSLKSSKVPELPRRKASPPPIDRIGTGRLPGNKG